MSTVLRAFSRGVELQVGDSGSEEAPFCTLLRQRQSVIVGRPSFTGFTEAPIYMSARAACANRYSERSPRARIALDDRAGPPPAHHAWRLRRRGSARRPGEASIQERRRRSPQSPSSSFLARNALPHEEPRWRLGTYTVPCAPTRAHGLKVLWHVLFPRTIPFRTVLVLEENELI